MKRVITAVAALWLGTAMACGGESNSSDLNEANEDLTTSSCPANLTIEASSFEMRTFFQEVREPAVYTELKSLSNSIKRLGTLRVSAALSDKPRGRCNYVNTTGSRKAQIALYTKSRKTIARVDFLVNQKPVSLYAYPKTVDPSGLTFDANSSARFVRMLTANSNPADDVDQSESGSPLFATLGTGKINGGGNSPGGGGGGATPSSLSAAVDALTDVFSAGGNTSEKVTSTNPQEMVKQYIAAIYADDAPSAFDYKWNATRIETDVPVAGTLRSNVVAPIVDRQVNFIFRDAEDELGPARAKAKAAVDAIIAKGGSFGFDGNYQNGCAAPAPMLLVLDSASKTVSGIDLEPCME